MQINSGNCWRMERFPIEKGILLEDVDFLCFIVNQDARQAAGRTGKSTKNSWNQEIKPIKIRLIFENGRRGIIIFDGFWPEKIINSVRI